MPGKIGRRSRRRARRLRRISCLTVSRWWPEARSSAIVWGWLADIESLEFRLRSGMQGPYTMRQRLEAARAEGRIMLGGHRGNPAEHPENTLSSFRSAIGAGCDLVECDVHLTTDGELAVIHDHTLERTTNGTGLVGAHSLAELRKLDAGEGQPIPLLEELFELVRDRVGLVIETKQNPIPYPGLEEKLVATLREHGMVD